MIPLFVAVVIVSALAMVLLTIGLARRPPRHCGKQRCDCQADRRPRSCRR